MTYFNYNGKLFTEGCPVISADNRGLRYGDGLFETIKMRDGRLVHEDDHFARLWKGLKVLEFELPKLFTVELLQKEIKQLAAKNGHISLARVRLSIIRGTGGLYDFKDLKPNYIIQTWPLPPGNGDWNSNGLVVGIYEPVKKSCDLLSNLKHNNYLPYTMAALAAKKQKWNDAILLNTAGNICDTTIANIFLIKDGIVYTPPLQEGCVSGIMRKHLIKYLPEINIPIIEKALSLKDLLSAREVFLTNSIYNLRWVQSIRDSIYDNAQTQQIFERFSQTIV